MIVNSCIESPEIESARHASEIDDVGFTVIPGVLSSDEVLEFADDIHRLERELPVVRENATVVVKGVPGAGHQGVSGSDHDWTRIDDLLLHGTRYESLPVHARVLPVVERLLGRDCLLSWLMTSTQAPGAVAQLMHSDDETYPIARPHPALSCTVLIALCDFEPDNGATRLVPHSHRWSRVPSDRALMGEPVSMNAGDALVWHGSLWHAAGANQTSHSRPAVSVNYCAGFLRQQVNHQLTLPRELVRRFDPRLRDLIGYGLFADKMGRMNWAAPSDYLDHDEHPFLGAVHDRITR